MGWSFFFYCLGAGLAVWFLTRSVRQNPELFSKENLLKSTTTLGGLALLLIAFIWVCVLILKG